jgi:L-iditol 2-dehydrogenase
LRVAVYHSNDEVRVEERPRPEIGPGELLLRIEASGICGSDVMEWYRRPSAPVVLGHEVAGTVVETGAGLDGFMPGDRVVATHHVPCNDCRYCRTDRHNICETLHRTHFDPGGFAELVRLTPIHVEHGTLALPDSVSFAQGTFVEPLACVVRGQRIAGLSPGDGVAVLGAGISGVLQIQEARARGAARIVTTDVDERRLEWARRLGADAMLRADEPALIERVREANDGRLPERVLVCTGAPAAMRQALEMVDSGGTVLFFAPLPPGETLDLAVGDLWKRGVTITHSYAGPPDDMRQALDRIATGSVDVASMVTHRLSLAETGRGFDLVRRGGDALKVVIEPQR